MLDWPGTRVLVTGASGFAGRRLCADLAGRGARITGLSREPSVAEGMDLLQGDIARPGTLEAALERSGARAVFHLAAQANVGRARADPVETFEANVRGTWLLLEACRKAGVARVVVVSSDAAYGHPRVEPCDEGQPLEGRGPYDVSKSCADLLAQSYAASYALPVAIARPANLFGPGDEDWTRLVPGTMRSAILGERPVIRSDGSPRRDYLHVDDFVAALVAMASRLDDPGLRGRAFNLATGESLSVLEMTRLALASAGRADLEPVVLRENADPARHKRLSIEAARTELGWRPQKSTRERLAETASWYRERLAAVSLAPGAG